MHTYINFHLYIVEIKSHPLDEKGQFSKNQLEFESGLRRSYEHRRTLLSLFHPKWQEKSPRELNLKNIIMVLQYKCSSKSGFWKSLWRKLTKPQVVVLVFGN